MPVIIVLAKERANYPTCLPGMWRGATTVALDITIPPRTPLRVGERVVVKILDPCDDFFPLANDGSPRYVARPSNIEGEIVAMRPSGNNLVEFTLRNEAEASTVAYATLSIAQHHGRTTNLSLSQRLVVNVATYLIRPTRDIPLELEAIVFDEPRRSTLENESSRGRGPLRPRYPNRRTDAPVR
ncbi:hypothetical protein PYCCODRAFT_667616 [Trametes coccinea BRFM310]|uniref:Uncharacterized protein n=1 Tax=Trametes coccinea (strain BRFM310) TaxID=1353009 RepID=A0A1Y2IHK9_TRAC3|nr:hypothetical protein PYCCODRAFT_667616 [Trametes coccinea BRFM310]